MAFLSYTQEFNDNLLMLLLRDHQRYLPIVEFFDKVTQQLSELSWAEAELIATQVSQVNHSAFCNGIRSGMVEALNANEESLKTEKLAPIVSFALKVNQDASGINEQDIQAVTNAGWSEQTVEDVVALVAAQKLYNTLATGLGFKALPAAAFSEIGRDTVDKGGYAASFRAFIEATQQPTTG